MSFDRSHPGRPSAARQDEGLSAFLALPPEHRELVLRNSPRAYPLAQALSRRGYALRFHDVREMTAAGRLAAAVADRLTARQAGRSEGELRDLRACAWGVLGNGLRIQGKADLAAAALGTAEEHLAAGTGRRHDVAALLLEFSASLRLGQGRWEEAQDLLARARRLRLALGDRHGVAKVRIQQGIATGRGGDPERAVRLLFEALHQVQDAPDLARVGLQNLIYQLIAADQPERARTVLARVRGVLEEGGNLFQLKLRWLDAKLAAAAGAWHPMILWQRYHGIRAGFARQGWLEEAAHVALDSAGLLAAVRGR